MYTFSYTLSRPVNLSRLVADEEGGTVSIPSEFTTAGGIYLIFNLQTNTRYMGVTQNMNARFGPRQQVCYELGFNKTDLAVIEAYPGILVLSDSQGGSGSPDNYDSPYVRLDGIEVDYEHLFIKTAQNLFGGFITNTLKAGPFINETNEPITARITWEAGGFFDAGEVALTLYSGETLE